MPIFNRLLCSLCLLLAVTPLLAQDEPAGAASSELPPAQALPALRSHLTNVEALAAANNANSNVSLNDLRSQSQTIQQQVERLTSALAAQVTSLQTRIDVLGPAPSRSGAEPAEISAQRRQLNRAQKGLQTQLSQATALGKEAAQLANHLAQLGRDQFQASLTTRTASPLSVAFWANPLKSVADDGARLREWFANSGHAAAQAWQPPNRGPLFICLILALLLVTVARWGIERAAVHITTRFMPGGKLRRSALATVFVTVFTLVMALAAHLVYQAFAWNDILDDELANFAQSIVNLVVFVAFLVSLGRSLLCNRFPTWRLPPLSDEAAKRLGPFPWMLGGATLLLGFIERLSTAIGTSLAATIVMRALLSLMIAALIGVAMVRLRRANQALAASDEKLPPRPLWLGLVTSALVLAVFIVILSDVVGYIALGFFVARQMLWIGTICMSLYLLMHLVDDIFDTVSNPKGDIAQRLQRSFAVSASRLELTGTMLSGICRAILVILAITLVASPYGAGPDELVTRVGDMLSGSGWVKKFSIVPENILWALLICLFGYVVLRLIKNWLTFKLLPTTSMDRGMQASIVTMLGYLGGILVFVLAMLALQVPIQSIAWMASALSVGIGFGLQAIVQNFISGLILLAERPVKVGDWVSIGDVEGDIRRINVRATEILMNDRSTMIVPNSQFITSNVRNVTRTNSQGRVYIKLPMPLDSDADKVRQIALEVMRAHPSTLDMPSPYVRLDSMEGGSLNFILYAYVRNPREALATKSDLLFEILQRLRDAQVPISSPQSMVVQTLPPPSPSQSISLAATPQDDLDAGEEPDDKR